MSCVPWALKMRLRLKLIWHQEQYNRHVKTTLLLLYINIYICLIVYKTFSPVFSYKPFYPFHVLNQLIKLRNFIELPIEITCISYGFLEK